jgi:DNA-binding SARP family transcriptional activator/tetratricopeptide (TPR) repeat protein
VQLFLLGPPRFQRDDRPVELTSAKAVALLAFLALTRTPQSRDRLLGLLWAESSEEAAHKNLRNTLWAIRKTFGEDLLQVEKDRLNLFQAAWIDVREFEKTADWPFQSAIGNLPREAAISLYRGPFLDGLNLSDAPEFETWLTAERERLGQTYLRLLAAQIDQLRAEANWRGVIDSARLALAQDNLQEPMYRALMEAHARLGERPEALRQYETLRATLAQELGVDPLPETEALRAAILRGELAGKQVIASPLVAHISKRQPVMGDVPDAARAPFVGRRAESALLDSELDTASSGRARIVLLTGELGIGKSRLWQEWSSALPPDLTVLETRCLDSTQAMPFAPLSELFGRHSALRHLFAAGSPVPSIWLAEVARLLPDIRLVLPDLPNPITLSPDEERLRVSEAITQCLLTLESRPLILFVDDLHWADRATLDWLDYLARRLGDLRPLLLVATYRPEDAPPALTQLLAGWGRDGLTRRIPLARLTDEESAALIVSLVSDPALRDSLLNRVRAQSAGNPYFLIELCRSASEDVPSALTELVRARLGRLPDPARQVLQAAAVLEPDFDFATLRRTSGRDEEETLDALDTLLNAAVVVERGGRYAFAHPLVAEVVRDGLSSARRVFLHRRAAESLEAAYAGRLPQIAGRLAAYYASADEARQAATYAVMAAERALNLAAYTEAAEFYRQAVTFEPTPERRLGLGRALYQKGDLTEARVALETALREFEAQGDREGAAEACITMYDTHLRAGHFEEVVNWAERGLPYIDPETHPRASAFAEHLIGAAMLHANRSLAEAEKHLREGARLALENHVPEVAARSRFGLGSLLAQRGDLAGALQMYREAIELAQAAGDQFHEVLGHNNAAYHALLLGDLASAREHIGTALALAEARALPVLRQWLYSTRGEVALAEMHWDAAEEWFKRGLVEAEKHDNPEMAANYRANLGLVARGRGHLDRALELLNAARTAAPTPHLQTQIDLWLAELHLQRGEGATAAEALSRAERQLRGSEHGRLQAWAVRLRQAQSRVTKRATALITRVRR